jgi:hypothetical protein
MRSFVILAAAVTFSGCVQEARGTRLAGAAASGTERCISARQISARRITGPRTLEFEVGRFTYRNDLPDLCPGLANRTSFGALQLEVDGSEICAGDSFRAFDPIEARAVGAAAFPRCRLGAFTRLEPSGR